MRKIFKVIKWIAIVKAIKDYPIQSEVKSNKKPNMGGGPL